MPDKMPDPDDTSGVDESCLDATLATDSSEEAGTVVGRYRLLQRIGEGGMGEVWLADQTEPVRRRVAVKLNALATFAPTIENYPRLRHEFADAVGKLKSIATSSGLRVIVAGPENNSLFNYILEEVVYKVEDLNKEGCRLPIAPLPQCSSLTRTEVRLYSY